jgi:DNA-directed RNA polymerase II subunit RPB7
LPPEYFGPSIREEIGQRLRADVEGSCHGRYGFIIYVLSVDTVSRGVLQDTYGYALFDITYKAIVLKPFKGEVVDAVVTTVNKAYRARRLSSPL